MRIEMKFQIAGTRNAERWPVEGTVIDLPEGEARDLISQGYAVEVVEKAVAPKPEVAERPVAKKAVAKKPEKRA